MANVTANSVAEALQRAWHQSPRLRQLVPGGLHANRVPQDVTPPYASLMVEQTNREATAGNFYLATFRAEVRVWSDDGAADAVPVAIALADDLDWRRTALVPGVRLVAARPLPGSFELDPATRAAADVDLTGAAWEVTYQGEGRP